MAGSRSTMRLYSEVDTLDSHCVRVVLAEKDIPVDIDYVDPDNPPEDLIHINPYNSVPTLLDRDLVLYGTRVITEYLDERYPHPPFMPTDPASRARTRLTLYRIEQDWYSLVPGLVSQDAAQAEHARKILRDSLVASAGIFAAKPFFFGDEYSFLDATLAPFLWRLTYYGVELPVSGRPILDYAERLFQRPRFQQSLSEVELSLVETPLQFASQA